MDDRWELMPEELSTTLLEDLDMPAEKLLNPAFRLLLNMKYHELYRHVLKKYRTMFGTEPTDYNLIHEMVIEFINGKSM